MRIRSKPLAWLLWTLAVAIALGAVVLLLLNRLTPVPRLGTVPRGLEAGWTLLLVVIFSTMGALITSRRPQNLIGWSFLAAGIGSALSVFATDYHIYATRTNPGSLALADEIAWLKNWVPSLATFAAFAALLLLFPDGALPSRRWRPVAWLVIAWIISAAAADFIRPHTPGVPGNPWLRPDGIAGQAADTISNITWLGGNLVVPAAVAAVVLRAAGWITAAAGNGLTIASGGLAVAGVTAMPVTAALAIYRYRLYDIDRIISRTVAYAFLTALLAVVYAAAVLILEPLLRPLTGESTLAVAASTLIVVAVSQPLRNRIRATVDQRFNRRRYNTARTIQAFSARLRDQIDLASLSDEMVRLIGQTMEPTTISMWLRPGPESPRIRP